MTKIGDQIQGLTFAQGVIANGDLNLKSLREGFAKLPPFGQDAAVAALKESGDALLAQLAVGLDKTTAPPKPAAPPTSYGTGRSSDDVARPTPTPPSGGEGSRGGVSSGG